MESLKTPEETKRYAEIAYHKAQQMKALVDDLFEIYNDKSKWSTVAIE